MPHHLTKQATFIRARGFTLIEVLVAILVLSFGMLGAVGMQAFAIQANRDARMQAQAANLARELAETMRGNKSIAALTGTANPYLVALTSAATGPASASYCLSVSNASSGCSDTTEVAKAQMTEWLKRLSTELPGARVTVCFDSAPYTSAGLGQWACTENTDGIAVIKIGWTRNVTDRTKTGADSVDRASTPSVIFPVTGGNNT